MKLKKIPANPTLADIGQLLTRLHECMEKRFAAGERRMKALESQVEANRVASEARDGVGGEIIEKLLQRLGKMNVEHSKMADAVDAMKTAQEATASTVAAIRSAQAANAEKVAAVKTAIIGDDRGHNKHPLMTLPSLLASWPRVSGVAFALFLLIKVGNAVWGPTTTWLLTIFKALWSLAIHS